MSFLRTLTTVAAGFAAAKGMDKYKQMGGMAGIQDMMKGAGGAGGMADQLGQMAEKMGIPGGSKAVQDMMNSFGGGSAAKSDAGMAGLGGLMSAMKGSMAAGGKSMDDLFTSMTAGTPVSVAAEDNAKLMIRAIIQAAKADGEIDAAERKTILDQLDDASPEEIAFVKEQLAAPVDLMGLAKDSGTAMAGQVYATSLMAIKVDNRAETAYLAQLATALGLDDATRDRIHASMGVPPLA